MSVTVFAMNLKSVVDHFKYVIRDRISARNGKFHETERCIVQNSGAFRGQYKRWN